MDSALAGLAGVSIRIFSKVAYPHSGCSFNFTFTKWLPKLLLSWISDLWSRTCYTRVLLVRGDTERVVACRVGISPRRQEIFFSTASLILLLECCWEKNVKYTSARLIMFSVKPHTTGTVLTWKLHVFLFSFMIFDSSVPVVSCFTLELLTQCSCSYNEAVSNSPCWLWNYAIEVKLLGYIMEKQI